MLYKIKNGFENFETSETKKIKRLQWVPVPNKHDGKSYRRILKLQDGPLIYAAWLLILQVASKCSPRWILEDSDGPLSAEDLADKTGFPEKAFERAFKVLTDPKIAWLEVQGSPDISADHPEVSGLKGREGKGIEGNRKESIGPKSAHCREDYEDFKIAWNKLPKPFPKVEVWTDKRRKALRVRLNDEFFAAHWREGLHKMQKVPFYRGENERGWTANIDYFLRPDSLVKIIEYRIGNGTVNRSADDAILEKMKREGFNV